MSKLQDKGQEERNEQFEQNESSVTNPLLDADEELPLLVEIPKIEFSFAEEDEMCNTEKEFTDDVIHTIAEMYDESEDAVREYIFDDPIEKEVEDESRKEFRDESGEETVKSEEDAEWEVRFEGLPFGPTEMNLSVCFAPSCGKLFALTQFLIGPDDAEEWIELYEKSEEARTLTVETYDDGCITLGYEMECCVCEKEAIHSLLDKTFDLLCFGEGFQKYIFPRTVMPYDNMYGDNYEAPESEQDEGLLSDEDAEKELVDAIDALVASRKETPWTREQKDLFVSLQRIMSRASVGDAGFAKSMIAYGNGTRLSGATRCRLLDCLRQMDQIRKDIAEKDDENVEYTFQAFLLLCRVIQRRFKQVSQAFLGWEEQ